MNEFEKTERNQLHRYPIRGAYDRETVYGIIDAARICHVAFAEGDQPFVIPTIHARQDDYLILHGSKSSRLLARLRDGQSLSIAFTFVDGLVVARTPFHNSMNYRSVIAFGRGKLIEDPAEKLAALQAVVEKLLPGRWQDSRPPTETELNSTWAVRVGIESASAKIRTGPPKDDEQDLDLPFWSGVLPLEQSFGEPEVDPQSRRAVAMPHYLANLLKPRQAVTDSNAPKFHE